MPFFPADVLAASQVRWLSGMGLVGEGRGVSVEQALRNRFGLLVQIGGAVKVLSSLPGSVTVFRRSGTVTRVFFTVLFDLRVDRATPDTSGPMRRRKCQTKQKKNVRFFAYASMT